MAATSSPIIQFGMLTSGSAFQQFSDFIIQLHGGYTAMQNNVKKLAPLMETVGFISIRTDRINRQFSHITGKKALASYPATLGVKEFG